MDWRGDKKAGVDRVNMKVVNQKRRRGGKGNKWRAEGRTMNCGGYSFLGAGGCLLASSGVMDEALTRAQAQEE